MVVRTAGARSKIVVGMAVMASLWAALLPTQPASAATGDIGHADQLYTGATNPPTADKPQSKLWYNDGLWWADMFDTVSKTWHIFRLDRSSQTWVDTGTRVDDRPQSSADTLWDGSTLYVGTQYVTVSDDATTRPSQTQQARLYRYSYSSLTKTYTQIASPSTISTNSSESLTIDKDTTGRVWATWTKVSGSSTSGYTSKVYINSSADGSSWGTPAVIPATGASVAPDDISGLVAFGKSSALKGTIGVLWSNHIDNTVYWATHKDGDALTTWKSGTAVKGSKQADDHLNLKTIDADAQGRVVAAVKTSLDELSTSAPTDPQINVLLFKPGTGSWTSTKFGSLAECHTRPLVMLDSTNNEVHVFATAPTSSGCSYAGQPGTIYEKTTSLDSPSFASGRGTPVIRDAASANMNNVTSMKQSVTAASGLVVLASNNSTKRYWHADETLSGGTTTPTAPAASFSASATSGTAPLTTAFTDTSTGSPTSWAWSFGNGSTSTAQNPSTTYTTAGTYTVTLTATNSAGSSTASKTITVTTSGGGSTTRTVTLNPEADSMVQHDSPSTPYGSADPLLADQQDSSTTDAVNSYLRFAVPALAAGESISAAKLSLYSTNGSNNGPAIWSTSTSWSESGMTWSSGRPARVGSSAVGNFGSITSTSTRYSTAVSGVTSEGQVSFELAPESTDGFGFPSRENATTANRPQLVLTITS